MATDYEYFRYLDHLGKTVPLCDLHQAPPSQGLIGLRHDVDHDLDIALEMAYWERQRGFRSTYFLLHTCSYWQAPDFLEKCRQLEDYGHEVGLHVNVLAEWMAGQTQAPHRRLEDLIHSLRDAGISVAGVAAHGDRLCYEKNFSNYWCFEELRGVSPELHEDGRTAEGPVDPLGRRALRYPADHILRRSDGQTLQLWGDSLRKLDLQYHAYHIPTDRYFSDSGGNWSRTGDPLDYLPTGERWQVLMHPIHWQGPQRLYFFLAAPRSGTKWLTETLNRATSIQARHEYILNQAYFRNDQAEKTTGPGFAELKSGSEQLNSLLLDAWQEISETKRDYAEVNVYLPRFLPDLKAHFGEDKWIFVYRDPAKIVKSLLNRNWYDTPEDDRHPIIDTPYWDAYTQFEKVCCFVADQMNRLADTCHFRLSMEEMTKSPSELKQFLPQLGLAVHPRLLRNDFAAPVNANAVDTTGDFSAWTDTQKRTFLNFCGPIATQLGYSYPEHSADTSRQTRFPAPDRQTPAKPRLLATLQPLEKRRPFCPPAHPNCTVDFARSGQVSIRIGNPEQHAHLMLGGSRWNPPTRRGAIVHLLKNAVSPCGFKHRRNTYLKASLKLEIATGRVGVILLTYDADGNVVSRRPLGQLSENRLEASFTARPPQTTSRFDIALYFSAGACPERFSISSATIDIFELR